MRLGVLLIATLACWCYTESALVLPHQKIEIDGVLQERVLSCPTTEVYRHKQWLAGEKSVSDCYEGGCDVPATRIGAKSDLMVFNLVVHVLSATNGTQPDGVDLALAEKAVARTRQSYQPYNIDFNLINKVGVRFHKDDKYYCIPAYDGGEDWWEAIQSMKEEYAEDPEFDGSYGSLLGIATFPWDRDVLTAQGGLWLNSITLSAQMQSEDDPTLQHELGHNLGLWHTHHGVSEVSCRSTCAENYHELIDAAADLVGDLCADTPATPTNYYCAAPGGRDCNRVGFGTTDFSNYMGYSYLPVNCADHFTDCQELRMHCWSCSALQSQLQSGSC